MHGFTRGRIRNDNSYALLLNGVQAAIKNRNRETYSQPNRAKFEADRADSSLATARQEFLNENYARVIALTDKISGRVLELLTQPKICHRFANHSNLPGLPANDRPSSPAASANAKPGLTRRWCCMKPSSIPIHRAEVATEFRIVCRAFEP